jgi:hypothetical protein
MEKLKDPTDKPEVLSDNALRLIADATLMLDSARKVFEYALQDLVINSREIRQEKEPTINDITSLINRLNSLDQEARLLLAAIDERLCKEPVEFEYKLSDLVSAARDKRIAGPAVSSVS